MTAWHVLRCSSGDEPKIAELCEELNIPSYCPKYRLIWLNRSKKVERWVPFIATYVFVWFDGEDAVTWHVLRALKGVFGFLGGADPWSVSDKDMSQLRSKIGDDGSLSLEIRGLFRKVNIDDRVRLLDGPFKGQQGVCETVNDENFTAGIKIGLLGRDVVVTTPVAWCDPDEDGRATPSGKSTGNNRRKRRRSSRNGRPSELSQQLQEA